MFFNMLIPYSRFTRTDGTTPDDIPAQIIVARNLKAQHWKLWHTALQFAARHDIPKRGTARGIPEKGDSKQKSPSKLVSSILKSHESGTS